MQQPGSLTHPRGASSATVQVLSDKTRNGVAFWLPEGSIPELEKLRPLTDPEEAIVLEAAHGPPILHSPLEGGCRRPGPPETVPGGESLYSTCEIPFPKDQERVGRTFGVFSTEDLVGQPDFTSPE